MIELSKAILDALSAPFPPDQLGQIDSKWNKDIKLTTVNPEAVIRRLNEVFGGAVNFEICSHGFTPDNRQAFAHVRITAQVWIKTPASGEMKLIETFRDGIGAMDVRMQQGQNNQSQTVDLGYDIKSAVTDGIKLAAKLFGVGLYLYEQKGNRQQASGSTAPNNQQQQHAPQYAQPFQTDKMMVFFNACNVTMEQVLQRYQIPALDKMPYNLACAIVSGQHPDIQDLEARNGQKMNGGIQGTAAK